MGEPDRAGDAGIDARLDAWARDVARRLADEVREDVTAEVRDLLRERLLDAALRELAPSQRPSDATAVPAVRARRPVVRAGEIDETIAAMGLLGNPAADPPPVDAAREADRSGSGLWAYGICSPSAAAPASTGVGTRPVELVRAAGRPVLVTRVPLAELEDGALERGLTDPAWLGENATAHERVLAEAMRTGPVLPLRFGTIFRDEEQLRAALEPHARLLGDALSRLEGRAEWDVKVLCDLAALRAWIEDTSPRIAAAASGGGGGDGEAYLRRKHLERAISREADSAIDEIGRLTFDSLAALADAAAPAAASSEAEGRVVVRADAYLVREDGAGEFWRAAEETETLLADRGIEVRVAGPLPPYHFASIDLREAADA
jgi:hypothetical protein